ncbi:MAG TPA: zf-HC2 domain-containing protein [Chthonomonadaceae bacterium]|nr:zf-HC2 domain-containing protein [Chthonomonadaceae bacterium]
MQCEHAQEFLSEYVTGEMDQALAVALENHLAVCRACTEAVDGLRGLWRTLDAMPLIEPPASFHASLMERIAAEQASAERAARTVARPPAWRTLFQPRAFAYAAAVLILLLGAELVQVQRAALGPLGLVLNLLHPTPLLQSEHATWMPNGQGGGVLTVTLQAHAQANGAVTRRLVRVQLHRTEPAAPRVAAVAREVGIRSDRATQVDLPLDYTPHNGLDTLDVTVAGGDGAPDEGQSVAIPLAPGM